MSETNKALARRVFDTLNEHDLTPVKHLYAADAIYHDLPPDVTQDWEGVVTSMGRAFEAFPDMRSEVDELVADGDRVAIRYHWTGTHTGPMADIPPTGKTVNMTGAAIYRFADGKITEVWLKTDRMTMLQQLGLMPAPGG